jgi:hypothetical protein
VAKRKTAKVVSGRAKPKKSLSNAKRRASSTRRESAAKRPSRQSVGGVIAKRARAMKLAARRARLSVQARQPRAAQRQRILAQVEAAVAEIVVVERKPLTGGEIDGIDIPSAAPALTIVHGSGGGH